MIKFIAGGILVIVIVIAGIDVVSYRFNVPDLDIWVDFPDRGTKGGLYAYYLGGFQGNDPDFSNPEIKKVEIEKGGVVAITNLQMDNSPNWSVRERGRGAIVAEGPYANWVAIRFDGEPQSTESYTLDDMNIDVRFDYDGILIDRTGLETTVTMKVPVPWSDVTAYAADHDVSWENRRRDYTAWGISWKDAVNDEDD